MLRWSSCLLVNLLFLVALSSGLLRAAITLSALSLVTALILVAAWPLSHEPAAADHLKGPALSVEEVKDVRVSKLKECALDLILVGVRQQPLCTGGCLLCREGGELLRLRAQGQIRKPLG